MARLALLIALIGLALAVSTIVRLERQTILPETRKEKSIRELIHHQMEEDRQFSDSMERYLLDKRRSR